MVMIMSGENDSVTHTFFQKLAQKLGVKNILPVRVICGGLDLFCGVK